MASQPTRGAPTLTVGWREWVDLPDLGLSGIKAKVDTGARTSALHAFAVEPYRDGGVLRARFRIQPAHRDNRIERLCDAEVVDQRSVKNSGGDSELRLVIGTTLALGDHSWPIELTLTARDNMKFRMLLGRTAINGRALVNPERSYLTGRRTVTRD
ncbi:MAG: ATP-dependent zinc protease [Pseudomonadota bacterium]